MIIEQLIKPSLLARGETPSLTLLPEDWFKFSRAEKYEFLRRKIGSTPIEQTELDGSIVISKLEYKNPSGSHYDRAYLETLELLESQRYIAPGDELRDITSGSAGISLALIGRCLDYSVRITVPPELPAARLKPITEFGAEVAVADPGGVPSASAFQSQEIKDLIKSGWKRQRIAKEDQAIRAIIISKGDQRICYVNHSENQSSPEAFSQIGHELVNQISPPLDYLVLAIGNWTTIAGIVPVVREAWSKIKIVGYEDSRNAPTYAQMYNRPLGKTALHDSFGTSVEGVPGLTFKDLSLLDEVQIVTPADRQRMDQKFNCSRPRLERVGNTSVMGLVVAERLAQLGAKTIGTVFYDQKLRY